MVKDKYDFITQLLETEKLSPTQKERVLLLTAKEIGDNGSLDILKRLENIEQKINTVIINTTKINEKENTSIENNKIKKHSPKTMVKFLYSFSINEEFKWFTHSPDGLNLEFNYKLYIERAQTSYKKITGWNINNITYYNVQNFIFNSGDKKKTSLYGRGSIELSWRDVEIWCNENPNLHPYYAQFDNEVFYKYINQFKQIIEFRTDDPDLTFNIRARKLIRDELSGDFNCSFSKSFNEIGQSLKIFCDINLLFNSLKQIIIWIVKNKAKSNIVEINLLDQESFFQLEIFHKHSYISMSPSDEKMKGLSGDFDKVRQMLFSVADWEIISTIKNNNKIYDYHIFCLDENTESNNNILTNNTLKELNINTDGVKHILRLYKTQNL